MISAVVIFNATAVFILFYIFFFMIIQQSIHLLPHKEDFERDLPLDIEFDGHRKVYREKNIIVEYKSIQLGSLREILSKTSATVSLASTSNSMMLAPSEFL